MTASLYFEDLFVGRKFQSIEVEVSAEEMIRFSQVNDPQFFHVDAEAAKDSIFGGLVASGWQTASLTFRLLLSGSGVTFAGGVVGVDSRISWKSPVRPGDRLRVEGEITETVMTRSRSDRGFARVRTRTFNQDGAEVQAIDATMLVFRDPARKADESGR
jgi:acyl dehydratase